jgi:hypothetical protein
MDTEKEILLRPGTKPSVLFGLEDLALTMNAFAEDALAFLAGLSDDEYREDRAHADLNHAIGRLNRMRLDLIQIKRQLE